MVKIPQKLVIDGRLEFGKRFIKQARQQLGILKDQMSYRELAVGQRKVKFNDDVHFICSIAANIETVIIVTDPWITKKIPRNIQVCPMTRDFSLAYVEQLNGMTFNNDGDPTIFPSDMYWSTGVTYDLFVCEGLGDDGGDKYSYWEACKPLCHFVHDHKDDEDFGWIYDVGAAQEPPHYGRQVIVTPTRETIADIETITGYRVTNLIPENIERWLHSQKFTTYRTLRY